MSKLAPRNAKVMIVKESDGRTYVQKRYLAVYTAVQERAAYDRLRPLCGPIRGIKMARVLAVDEKKNSLRLEYVPGKSLYETVEVGNLGPLIEWRKPLVELFTAARTRGIRFDGDPSNFIVHAETGQLVIIDPVCVDLQIEDFAMVVFLWGLIKLMLRNPRPWRFTPLMRVWCAYFRDYRRCTGADPHGFNRQMACYIDMVIGWNKEISPVDDLFMAMLRRYVAVPLYTFVKWLFRWNLVRV